MSVIEGFVCRVNAASYWYAYFNPQFCGATLITLLWGSEIVDKA